MERPRETLYACYSGIWVSALFSEKEERLATLEFILLAASAVLISAILDEIIPRLSMPLIQIGLGIIIALLSWNPITLDVSPDIFLLFFIAPLLYYEAKNTDRTSLWRNHANVLSLAIGLVVAIMLIVGFTLHLLVPSVSLAAAFALGAALGPTDAVAVSSMKSEVKLTRRENALLNGECLLNDASGVVAFQFAVAACVSGFYSVQGAIADFTIEFFGGIALGIVIALAMHFIQQWVRDLGLESITFFSLLDLIAPFGTYILSEMIGVSGILAVVACGLLVSGFADRRIGPSVSKLNIHQDNVWKAVSFILNGIVFVILGLELPQALQTSLQQPYLNNGMLIMLVLVITAVLVFVRFGWLLIMERLHRNPVSGKRSPLNFRRVLSCVALTIGGPKGAVTLSIILSVPYFIGTGEAFPDRDLIIFIASGVILCTLLLANFVLPLVSPTPKKSEVTIEYEERAGLRIEILRNVIHQLSAEQRESNANATRAVIAMYNDRIERIISDSDNLSENKHEAMERMLNLKIVRHQMQYVSYLLKQGKAQPAEAYRLTRRLSLQEQILSNHRSLRWKLKDALHRINITIRALSTLIRQTLPGVDENEKETALRELRIEVERETVRYLEHGIASGESKYPPELLAEAIAKHTNIMNGFMRMRPSLSFMQQTLDETEDIMRKGYRIELDEIQKLYDNRDISRGLMKLLRENVYLMQLDLENRL